MQWLTAVLAFATTMLIFAIIVTTLVETLHRICASRTRWLEKMLKRFYHNVLDTHITENEIDLSAQDFIRQMIVVRPGISTLGSAQTIPHWWSFKRLSELPVTAFMERLGSSNFASVLGSDASANELLLKDIAHKYENYSTETSSQFEPWARLRSVFVALAVAWVFYIHPYKLMHTYLENPQIAERVADLKDDALDDYEILWAKAELVDKKVDNAATLVNKKVAKITEEKAKTHEPIKLNELDQEEKLLQSKFRSAILEMQKATESIKSDLESAKAKVNEISDAGAPLGWEGTDYRVWSWSEDAYSINLPRKPIDIIWLILGGLLIGLGAPFWVKLIKQVTALQQASKNVTDILKPQREGAVGKQVKTVVGNDAPVTSAAFVIAAAARTKKNQ